MRMSAGRWGIPRADAVNAAATMFNHAPPGYVCPFCHVADGVESDAVFTRRADVVLRTELCLAFVASHWWPNNAGHVLVVPIAHLENMYDLPRDVAADVHETARRVAIAMKRAYGCPGVSTRQHNEPAGDQEVWHYHLHVFPRYPDDRLYESGGAKRLTTPAERHPYADRLRRALADGGAV